jgi:CheY-like chemotaxis protein
MKRARILVVEDNQPNRLLIRCLLELRGHEVVEAETVAEARSLLRPRPQVILTDYALPGERGDALLATVRGDRELASTPVVVVTASAMIGDRERLLSVGFDAYVSKPIDTKRFGPFVDTLVEKSKVEP